jgi:hypothetical protein
VTKRAITACALLILFAQKGATLVPGKKGLQLFIYEVPALQLNPLGTAALSDSFWEVSVEDAVRELTVDTVQIGGRLFANSQAGVDAICFRAKLLYFARLSAYVGCCCSQ